MLKDSPDNWKVDINDSFKKLSSREKILHLLKFGILAPSTHNCQPWLFKIVKNTCEIYKNESIQLPEADQTGRDMYISFGCLIENIVISAEYYNIKIEVEYVLDEKKNLIAKIIFFNLDKIEQRKNKNDSLIRAIMKRQTVRGKFQNKSISVDILSTLRGLNNYKDISVDLVTNKEDILKISHLTADGMRLAYKSTNFRKEMAAWFRTNISRKKEGLPGYALGMPTLLSLIFPTVVRYFNIGKIVGKLNFKSISSAPLICVFTSKKNDKEIWLNIGRLVQKSMLILVSKNINVSIFVAAVEIGKLHLDLQKVLKTENIPQFLFCAGYTDIKQKHTARYSVEEKIIT